MSPSKRSPISSRLAAKSKISFFYFYFIFSIFCFSQSIPEFGRHDDAGGKVWQSCVLHRRVVVDSPVHPVPPLAACCTIVLDPFCVPPPHVLEHVPQLHALHSQLAQAGIIRYMIYICCILLFSSHLCSPKLLGLILVVPIEKIKF